MHNLKTIRFLTACVSVTGLTLILVACSDERTEEQASSPITEDFLRITFSAGPNAGEHHYVAGQLPNAGVSVSYSRPNDVSFFAASGLVSEDKQFNIGSLRRFTEGKLRVGENPATSWLPKKNPSRSLAPLDCGRLEIRDTDNSKPYTVVYGTFVECGATTIQAVGEWQVDKQKNRQSRRVTGSFSDRVKLQMAMDDARFQNIESQVLVEFSMTQHAAAAVSN